MTSTSVKDVSTVMKSYTANVANAAAANGKASFQEVWSNQTGRQTASEEAADNKKVSGANGMDKAARGEALKAKDAERLQRRDEAVSENDGADALDEKKLEEAMEVLGAAVTELMQEIADAFGMSMEELEQLMADMNMEPVDLLDTNQLAALLLEAGGAADSLALLTDEGLCENFQALMNRQKEMFAEVSEKLQMTPEQLMQVVEEMNSFQTTDESLLLNAEPAEAEDMVQITVETDEEQTEEPDTTSVTDKNANVVTEEAVTKTESGNTQQTAQEGSQEKQSDTPKDQTTNLLIQNLKAENFKPELQQVEQRTGVWNENTQDIMRQIMDYMKIQVKADTSSLEMQLHPASLGTLQVQVASKGGVLTANFITQNETVKAALESQLVQLKESFAEQGVKVEAIEVTVQTHQFESSLEQGRGRQQGEMDRKSRPRRINLNDALVMEDLPDMTEEEQLAAEMMTANGSTVDYTA